MNIKNENIFIIIFILLLTFYILLSSNLNIELIKTIIKNNIVSLLIIFLLIVVFLKFDFQIIYKKKSENFDDKNDEEYINK